MLSDRKKKILCAVVDDYIDKASPVSSKDIQETYLPECSSATIRNELSALESMGYLIQPHVSAGRVPSEKAFRFYVDELASSDPLTADETELIETYFTKKNGAVEDLVTAVTHVISEVTNYTSVMVKSDMSDSIVAIRLVDLSNGKMLAVIVTDSRVLKDGVVDIPDEFTPPIIAQAERWLNKLFVGKHVSEFVNFNYPYALVNDQFQQFNALFKKIIDVLKKVSLENGMDVETYGENKIFQHSEYSDVQNAEKFLLQMEHKQQIAHLFTDDGGADGAVTIKIGSEDNAPDGCSVITTRVNLGDNVSGSIGVIGPVRMNYKKVLCVLDKISNIIIDLVGNK
ncbi:MAG: heat-inducible transcriptional repressor HrcA [Corallococcus sp.]|nr:heat-inducible transcriptional repressor HrcA [Corallococcus sp.]MCM1360073.1 heat-inducible transcriptional repressor HrcA [Corallococcus sp.]MCM1395630.1 heat-inducible transcriptional repressor HrcA [Corallococcus sp.]